jgi:outer membrane protein assembly factor BamB
MAHTTTPSAGRKPGVLLLVLALVASIFTALSPAPPARAATLVDPLPPIPLNAVVAPGSTTATGPDGEPRLYFVSSGSEAVLSIADARTGDSIEQFPLPQAGGAWAVDALPNGDVYIGTYGTGRLFRYVLETNTVEDLGVMVEGETFIWSLTHDENGVVYGGTGQTGGHIFSFDPETGITRDFGPFGTPEVPVLVRAMAVGDGTIYVGTSPTPSLHAIDIATGERTELSMPDVAGQQSVYDLDLRAGLLFLRVSTSGSPQPLHVYDIEAGQYIEAIPSVHGLRMSPIAADGNSVYFVKDGALHRYDLAARTWEPTGLTGISDVRAFGFLNLQHPDWPGQTLVGSDYMGNYFLFSPADNRSTQLSADVAGAAANMRSMAEGPDGRIYFNSYLGGDLAVYDPATAAMTRLAETPQAESMATHDGALYMGTYPRAEILRYDPTQPVQQGTNPGVVLSLYNEGQSRPWALESAGKYLAIGTVPHNGAVGGALAILDTRTGEHWTEEVAGGQSVVGLAYRDGVLYGTTSVFGGSGAPRPADREGVLFAYDIEQRAMLWQIEPHEGEGAFGQIAFDKQGHLWIASPTMAFKVDVDSHSVVASRSFGTYPWDDVEYVWVASQLWVDPYDDQVYVMAQGSVWRIDPETMDRARVFRPASYALMATNGFSYVARDTSAWAWQEAPRPAVHIESSEGERGSPMTVTVTGLGPDEPVALWQRPGAVSLGEVRADSSGVATASVWIPVDEPLGSAAIEIVRPLTGAIIRANYEVLDVQCDETLTGDIRDGVHIASGTTCLSGADVRGGIEVTDGASIVVTGSEIHGGLAADAASLVSVVDTSIRDGVTVAGTTGFVHLVANDIRGGVKLTNGGGPAATVQNNEVRGGLACSDNALIPILDGNSVRGAQTGQCAPQQPAVAVAGDGSGPE